MRCSARTAPASRRSPRSWPASSSRAPERCCIDGREVRYRSPYEALSDGIAMVFQETSLVPSMTVAQNIYLGKEKPLNRLRGIYIAAQQFLQSLNFTVDPAAIGRHPRRRQAADGRDRPRRAPQGEDPHLRRADRDADARGEAPFLRADEAAAEDRRLDRLHHPRARGSAGACRPHHHPARRRAGGVTGRTAEFDRDKVVRAMVGRALLDEIYNVRRGAGGDPQAAAPKVLSVRDISMGTAVRNNSFSVFEGQITGVFGLIGSGRTETFKIVAGIYKRDFRRGGEIELDGRKVRYRVPAAGGARPRRLRHRGPQERGLLRDDVDRRELLLRPARRRARRHPPSSAWPRCARLSARMVAAAQRQGDQRRGARRRALRRQPAEGRHRQGPDPDAAPRSSSTSRRAASTSAPSRRSTS